MAAALVGWRSRDEGTEAIGTEKLRAPEREALPADTARTANPPTSPSSARSGAVIDPEMKVDSPAARTPVVRLSVMDHPGEAVDSSETVSGTFPRFTT